MRGGDRYLSGGDLFQRGKGESRIKLETFLANRASNDDIIARVRKDKAAIESRMQYD